MGSKALAFGLFAAGLCLSQIAAAQDNFDYRMERGETLIGIGQKYLIRPLDYRTIQKANRIADPRAIHVGTIVRIPRMLLKFKPSNARLATVRGQVTVAERPASAGQMVNEGQTIRTAGGSSASIILEDGSRISLPSNSQVKIMRLRRYLLASALDYDFRVDKGDARSRVVPLKSKHDRYQVRTPKAISAVRGTEFQTRYDETGNRDFAEVDEGALAVDLMGGTAIPVASGTGLSVKADGSSIKEAMLPPPDVKGAGRLQNDSLVRFNLPAFGNDTSGFRIGIAADAGFQDQLVDIVAKDGDTDLGALPDGNYFFRIRAVSVNGIEGLPATYAFKRRLNSVKASAGAGDAGWAFKWDGEGQGLIRYHFQLYKGGTDKAAMVDEPALDAQQIILSDLKPDTYFWRVGAVQYTDGESNINWTPFEKITVSAE
ncbi:MAG: FecR domain-containing protein [Sphingorhabdus sp.]